MESDKNTLMRKMTVSRKQKEIETRLGPFWDEFGIDLEPFFHIGAVGSSIYRDDYNDLDIILTVKKDFENDMRDLFVLAADKVERLSKLSNVTVSTKRAPLAKKGETGAFAYHLFFEPSMSWPFASPGCREVWARTCVPLYTSSFDRQLLPAWKKVNWIAEIERYFDVLCVNEMSCWVFGSSGMYKKEKIRFEDDEALSKLHGFALVLCGLVYWYSAEIECQYSDSSQIAKAGLPILGDDENRYRNLLLSRACGKGDFEFVVSVCKQVISHLRKIEFRNGFEMQNMK